MFMRIGIAKLLLLGTVGLFAAVAAQDSRFVPRRFDAKKLRLPVPQEAIDRQFTALSRMQGVEVEYTLFGSVGRLKGHTNLFISPVGQSVPRFEPANEIFAKLSTVLAAKGTEMLVVHWTSGGWPRAPLANSPPLQMGMAQTIRGWTVRNAGGQISIDPSTGEIIEATFTFIPDYGLPAKPRIGPEQAARLAAGAVEAPKWAAIGSVDTSRRELKYHCPYRRREKCTLVWEVHTFYRSLDTDPYGGTTIILVDAIEGRAMEASPVVYHAAGGGSSP
jgi:hypothetical protein